MPNTQPASTTLRPRRHRTNTKRLTTWQRIRHDPRQCSAGLDSARHNWRCIGRDSVPGRDEIGPVPIFKQRAYLAFQSVDTCALRQREKNPCKQYLHTDADRSTAVSEMIAGRRCLACVFHCRAESGQVTPGLPLRVQPIDARREHRDAGVVRALVADKIRPSLIR